MFSLANSFVPIEEFINLPNLIKRFCIENPLNTADVPSKIMPLTMIVLENIVEVKTFRSDCFTGKFRENNPKMRNIHPHNFHLLF